MTTDAMVAQQAEKLMGVLEGGPAGLKARDVDLLVGAIGLAIGASLRRAGVARQGAAR